MGNRRWFVVAACAVALALVGVGCGGSDSNDTTKSSSGSKASANVEPTDDETRNEADSELDPDLIDPCLLEPAEIQALIAANPEPLGQPYEATLSAGVRKPESPNQCEYTWTFNEPGSPSAVFSLSVYSPRPGCLVEHRGVCLLVTTTYGDAPIVVPDSLDQAVKARIDAQ